MFIVAESAEGNVWRGIAGFFASEDAARRFQESLEGKWKDRQVFPVTDPHASAYPFFLTNQGLDTGCVRPIGEAELKRLLAEAGRSAAEEDTILFNVYSVLADCINQRFPGEWVLPKLHHYHVMVNQHDYEHIRAYLGM